MFFNLYIYEKMIYLVVLVLDCFIQQEICYFIGGEGEFYFLEVFYLSLGRVGGFCGN